MDDSVKIHIKATNGDKFQVDINLQSTVADLKIAIHGAYGTEPDSQRLIFKGHVLKDDATLTSYGVEAGQTVILVPKKKSDAPPKPQQFPAEAKRAPSPTQRPAPVSGAMPGMGDPSGTPPNPFAAMAGMGGANPFGGGMNLQQMQQQLMQNPEMMQQLMDNPMVRSMMDDPELMRSMMMNNPQIRQLMEQNPEIGQILNDPEVLRQSMNIARNPHLMREMQRNTDRAMSNIEAHPEGFNALRRMYENVQEPLMNLSTPPEPQSETNITPDDNAPAPVDEPLPNPWAPQDGQQRQQSPQRGAAGGLDPAALGMNPFGMNVDPNMMAGMMDNPMFQSMLTNMFSNPEALESMMSMNPMTRQMMEQNPQMREMLRSEQFRSMLSNPEAIRAMLQMQSAMGRLQGAQGSAPNPGVGAPSGGAPGAGFQGFPFGGMFPQAQSGGIPAQQAPVAQDLRPEILYREQLATLNSMGFIDAEANINALIQTGGNLQAAIERLLQQ